MKFISTSFSMKMQSLCTALSFLVALCVLAVPSCPVLAQRSRPASDADKKQNPIVTAVAKGEIEQVKEALDKEPELINHLSSSRGTLLHYAVTSRVMSGPAKRAAMITLLLDKGADPNFSGPNLVFTPLINAIRNRDQATVELLLAHKADPGKADRQGATPLEHALKLDGGGTEGDAGEGEAGAGEGVKAAIVGALLKAGVGLDRWDSRGRYPLHLAAGSATSDPALVSVMLANGADINIATRAGTERVASERSTRELRPLHIAAESGSVPVVKLLLDKGADVNARSEAGDTPLHRAARVGSPAIETLLAAGANANLKNGVGDTPLHQALRVAVPPVLLKSLIQKSDLSLRDRYGLTPLLLALVARQKTARDLLAASDVLAASAGEGAEGAGGNTAGNATGETRADTNKTDARTLAVLHATFDAAAQNDVARLTRLITGQPHLASARLSIGWTPLHVAALWSAKDTTRLLLDKGVEVDARDGQGATPLLRALQALKSNEAIRSEAATSGASTFGAISGDVRQVVNLLVAKGASVNAYASTESPAYAGNLWRSHLVDTPLNRAIVAGDIELVTLFLGKGANIRDRTDHFDTPLLVAVKSGQSEIVPLLLKAGADVNARDEVSMTALTRALSNSHFDLVRVLVEAGADVNLSDTNGTTPLMWAAMRGSIEMAKFLIDHKAEVAARTRSGESAIGAAKRYRGAEMIEFLKQNGVPE